MHGSFDAPPPFRPTLRGCVAKDRRLSRMLEEAYAGELYAVAANTYRSLVCEAADARLSALFDEIAVEEAEHFRLVGDLILSLGGNPALHAPLSVDRLSLSEGGEPAFSLAAMTEAALREKRRVIERYQTLMGRTEDRIVRSLLSYLLADEERHAASLRGFLNDCKK